MILYYAVGGGLGHLSRAKKLFQYYGITDYKVITSQTSNPVFSIDQVVCLDVELQASPVRLYNYIKSLIEKYDVSTFFIDTFPTGILGELNVAQLREFCTVNYVARYVKWDKYKEKLPHKVSFDKSIIVDDLCQEQYEYIKSVSLALETIQLPILGFTDNPVPQFNEAYWLINHSGPSEEVLELLAYAQEIAALEHQEPLFVINTQSSMITLVANDKMKIINNYPATALFKQAAKIITACGFNVMQETISYSEKHVFIPFNRKYDDQFLRALNRRNRLVSSCDGNYR